MWKHFIGAHTLLCVILSLGTSNLMGSMHCKFSVHSVSLYRQTQIYWYTRRVQCTYNFRPSQNIFVQSQALFFYRTAIFICSAKWYIEKDGVVNMTKFVSVHPAVVVSQDLSGMCYFHNAFSNLSVAFKSRYRRQGQKNFRPVYLISIKVL